MLPVYNIVLGEDGGMDAIALVQDPAVEVSFLAFADEKIRFNFNDEKRIILGPVCICDKLIYRYSESLGEYYVKFSKETIEEMMLKYSKDNLFNSLNFNHNDEDVVNNVYMIESFIKDTAKGIAPAGFENVSDGSWFIAFKVCDDSLWETLKQKDDFTGFSLQGYFDLDKINFNAETKEEKEDKDPIEEFLDDILK